MNTVKHIKDRIFARMAAMDVENMTIDEIERYAKVAKDVADINEKSYADVMNDMLERIAKEQTYAPQSQTGFALGFGGGSM